MDFSRALTKKATEKAKKESSNHCKVNGAMTRWLKLTGTA